MENFNYRELEESQWRSLRDWLKTEADLHAVFYVTTTKGDGWIGEMGRSVLYSVVIEEPVQFNQALALEDEVTQSITISSITFEAAGFKGEFEQFMSGLVLPDTATDGDRNVLIKIISQAETNWNMNITNPQTGDPVGRAALLMAISGFGVAFLWKKEKTLH